MITPTKYFCKQELILELCKCLPSQKFPLILNQPTVSFFYDRWCIKDEYAGTLFDKVLQTIQEDIGQARIIELASGNCYNVHADIDDRFHLNLSGEESYLVDLDNKHMFKSIDDGVWYSMDASKRHSAINFGRGFRYQLVVRKLLNNPKLKDSTAVKIVSRNFNKDSSRFIFDNYVSPWLNKSCKLNLISNFEYDEFSVNFDIERSHIANLNEILPDDLEIIYND